MTKSFSVHEEVARTGFIRNPRKRHSMDASKHGKIGLSYDEKRSLIEAAFRESRKADRAARKEKQPKGAFPEAVYVRDLFDDHAIVSHEGKLHKVGFKVDGEKVVLNETKPVVERRSYEPA